MTRHPLMLSLAFAVPLEIEHLREADDELRAQLIAEHTGKTTSTLLGSKGDQLLFGGKDCASVFAAVARGLACLAWAPGGVTFAGMHFCARHDLCLKADAELGDDPGIGKTYVPTGPNDASAGSTDPASAVAS